MWKNGEKRFMGVNLAQANKEELREKQRDKEYQRHLKATKDEISALEEWRNYALDYIKREFKDESSANLLREALSSKGYPSCIIEEGFKCARDYMSAREMEKLRKSIGEKLCLNNKLNFVDWHNRIDFVDVVKIRLDELDYETMINLRDAPGRLTKGAYLEASYLSEYVRNIFDIRASGEIFYGRDINSFRNV